MQFKRALFAAGLAALLVTAVACGDDDGASGTTSEATMPDTAPPTSGAADDCPAEPTEDAAAVLIGLTEDEAAEAAEVCGWTTRVVRRDGEDLAVTLDFRPDRVNVEVTDGEVIAIVDIG